MHVGMATVFQNTGRAVTDRQIYLNELALADLAEPLGFESIWSVEPSSTTTMSSRRCVWAQMLLRVAEIVRSELNIGTTTATVSSSCCTTSAKLAKWPAIVSLA